MGRKSKVGTDAALAPAAAKGFQPAAGQTRITNVPAALRGLEAGGNKEIWLLQLPKGMAARSLRGMQLTEVPDEKPVDCSVAGEPHLMVPEDPSTCGQLVMAVAGQGLHPVARRVTLVRQHAQAGAPAAAPGGAAAALQEQGQEAAAVPGPSQPATAAATPAAGLPSSLKRPRAETPASAGGDGYLIASDSSESESDDGSSSSDDDDEEEGPSSSKKEKKDKHKSKKAKKDKKEKKGKKEKKEKRHKDKKDKGEKSSKKRKHE